MKCEDDSDGGGMRALKFEIRGKFKYGNSNDRNGSGTPCVGTALGAFEHDHYLFG